MDFHLLIDIRRFQVAVDSGPTAEIGLSAIIVDKDGKLIAARLVDESETFEKVEPQAAAAFGEVFGRIAKNMNAWSVQVMQ